jgi:hypothetical protein
LDAAEEIFASKATLRSSFSTRCEVSTIGRNNH